MINIILPILHKFDDYKTMIGYLSKRKDIKVYIGLDERFSIDNLNSNFVVKIFKAKSAKEEIINSLHTLQKDRGGIMVVRRPLKEEEFEGLIKAEEDISYLNKSKNSFVKAWKNFWCKVIKRFFAFNYFDDISAIYFKESIYDLISSLTNLSYISRINRFVGLSIKEVDTNVKPTKRDYDRFSTAVNFLSFLLFFTICIMCSVILCTALGANVLNVLLAFAISLIGFVFFLIAILNLARTVAVGRLRFGRAEEKV